MNENDLKKLWEQAGEKMSSQSYAGATIEQFINSRSTSIREKIGKLIGIDIVIKSLVLLSLAVNIYFYLNTQQVQVLYVCLIAIGLLTSLIYFEFRTMKHFQKVTDPSHSARENLSSMLLFLESRFDTSVLAIASTHLFFFTSGLLIYFYTTYGRVRTLDAMDYFVFGVFYLIGIIMGFVVTNAQVKFHIKHLKTCLSDLNENVMEIVSGNIETQRKQDRGIKMLLSLLLIFGFVLLIFFLKLIGG